MDLSYAYVEVENMIRRGEVQLSDLERLLEGLQREQRITLREQERLLELAWSTSLNRTN